MNQFIQVEPNQLLSSNQSGSTSAAAMASWAYRWSLVSLIAKNKKIPLRANHR